MWKAKILPLLLACAGALILAAPTISPAQYSEQAPASPPPASPSVKTQESAPVNSIPDEGGPGPAVDETVTRPRPRAPAPPPPPPDAEKKVEKLDADKAPMFHADVDLVNVSVSVQDKNGNFIPNLKKENFKLSEDGVPQNIQKMSVGEAPMTVCMVIEDSTIYGAAFLWDTIQAAFYFLGSLKTEDWVAVMFYDMRTQVVLDFTHNKAELQDALTNLVTPGFSEANLYDALHDAMGRMQDIDGKKAIVLISSGVDTFSRLHFDQILKEVQASDTPIFAVGTGQAIRLMADGRGAMSSETDLTLLQADNQLRTFAKDSGGRAYFPRFEGEYPQIYNDIAAALRNQYTLTYTPTNAAHDGKFRKVKVDMLDTDGKPLKLTDPKGKELKYEVRTRDGYTAPRPVE